MYEFEASLGYIETPCLTNQTNFDLVIWPPNDSLSLVGRPFPDIVCLSFIFLSSFFWPLESACVPGEHSSIISLNIFS